MLQDWATEATPLRLLAVAAGLQGMQLANHPVYERKCLGLGKKKSCTMGWNPFLRSILIFVCLEEYISKFSVDLCNAETFIKQMYQNRSTLIKIYQNQSKSIKVDQNNQNRLKRIQMNWNWQWYFVSKIVLTYFGKTLF